MRRKPSWLRSLAISWLVICTSSGSVSAAEGLLDPQLIELYRGTSVNPFDVTGTNNLAIKMTREGEYDRALQLLTRAQQLAPDRRDIARNAEKLQLLMAQMTGLDLETTLSYRRTFRDIETSFIPEPWGLKSSADSVLVPSSSEDNAQEVESSNPFDTRTLLRTADIKLSRGDIRGALTDLRRAKILSPWLSELDDQILFLESQLSETDPDDRTLPGRYLPGSITEELDNLEPPPAWLE